MKLRDVKKMWSVFSNSLVVRYFPTRKRRGQRGAALVEYAFVLILFLSLLFGISGFGHALYVYHAINNAAKEGTRWAAVNGHNCNNDLTCDGTNGMNNLPASKAQIESYVSTHLPPSLDL